MSPRQLAHVDRQGVKTTGKTADTFKRKAGTDKMSNLAANKKSIHPPTADAAMDEVTDRKIDVIKSRNKRRKEQIRKLNKKLKEENINKEGYTQYEGGLRTTPNLPGLGGGGGGTNAVTGKAKTKTLGNTARDLVKIATFPFSRRNIKPDPAEKFAEEYVTEDDMKGMSVKSGHKRPTKSGAGMTKKGVAAYRRKNPGSKLQTAVTGKVKKGSKDAKRRKSYCARSAGQMKKFPKAAKDPNSRLRQARRRWKC